MTVHGRQPLGADGSRDPQEDQGRVEAREQRQPGGEQERQPGDA